MIFGDLIYTLIGVMVFISVMIVCSKKLIFNDEDYDGILVSSIISLVFGIVWPTILLACFFSGLGYLIYKTVKHFEKK